MRVLVVHDKTCKTLTCASDNCESCGTEVMNFLGEAAGGGSAAGLRLSGALYPLPSEYIIWVVVKIMVPFWVQ